jgi:hypothetical protein
MNAPLLILALQWMWPWCDMQQAAHKRARKRHAHRTDSAVAHHNCVDMAQLLEWDAQYTDKTTRNVKQHHGVRERDGSE